MAAQYKTQCPHCGAQFKIGEQHLRQARGAVRCGSCLQVFQATEHLIEAPPRPAATDTAPRQPGQTTAPVQKSPSAGKKRSDDESWAEELLARETPAARPAPAPAPTRNWTLDEGPGAPGTSDAAPADSDDEQNDTRVSLGGGLELSDSFLSLDEEGDSGLDNEDFTDMSGAGRSHQGQGGDESWAEALLQELEEEESPTPGADGPMALQQDADKAKRSPARKQPAENPLFKASPGKNDPQEGLDVGLEDAFDDDFDLFADNDALGDYEPAPERPKKKSPPVFDRPRLDIGHALKWGGLSIAAVLVLAGQYLVFNYDRLARTPEWRPLYANACDVLGCTLPNPSDIRQLRGTNLVVRTHSRVEGALVVDAILYNHAHYEQPFPVLELSFSSLRGQPVASRRFTPDEYLRGELAGMNTMPRDVPIRVSFEILNPGADAESYRLYFHPAPGA
ncbi:zinc-ribbon and DUF3426 domain-containing protein [Alcanivorax sp. JB21]|uniref:zinc-ribbon and DUF3426 domain-containing protein n=1 Tax=Alcanivorax limicola TaxID=2874102 RepID=UPI001CBE058A|nr:zinc-ribbon and DUF3426 domain-containing protein [Alcanivorax limicola]MBZ2190039.1 zinc-ribbon and DUF3426 domain-containing protein [Alcanivorax limicola]